MQSEEEAKQQEKQLQASLDVIVCSEKKRKVRFAAILDVIFNQIHFSPSAGSESPNPAATSAKTSISMQTSNTSLPSTHHATASSQPHAPTTTSEPHTKKHWYSYQPSKSLLNDTMQRRLENMWKDCVRKDYSPILQTILDSLNKTKSGFLAKLINASQVTNDILQALQTILFVVECLEPVGIRELMEGVLRNSILHIVFCCIDSTNKRAARIIGSRILVKIIVSYDIAAF